MNNLSLKIYGALDTASVYDEKIRHSDLAQIRNNYYKEALQALQEAHATKNLKTIIEVEKTFNVAMVDSGTLNADARSSAMSSIQRADQALLCLDYCQNGYSSYKQTIETTPLERYDSKGLPKDTVRTFINSQRTTIRNQNSNNLIDKSNPLSTEINQQRRDNIELAEKMYKAMQIQHMQEYIKDKNYNQENPIVKSFMQEQEKSIQTKNRKTIER